MLCLLFFTIVIIFAIQVCFVFWFIRPSKEDIEGKNHSSEEIKEGVKMYQIKGVRYAS